MTDRYYKDLKRFKGYRHPLWGVMSFHHFSYRHLKTRYSIYWVDGVYLPTWFHVPVVHVLLGGSTRVRGQWLGKFPNPAQRGVHALCRIHFMLVPLLVGWVACWILQKV
jgi:hypothetical protein